MSFDIIVTTLESVPGYEVEKVLGIVWGSTIRARHVGKDIKMVFKHLVGGELTEYTQMLEEARREAVRRMVEHARSLEADAVIGVRFSSVMVVSGAAELMAYGTAVKFKKS